MGGFCAIETVEWRDLGRPSKLQERERWGLREAEEEVLPTELTQGKIWGFTPRALAWHKRTLSEGLR